MSTRPKKFVAVTTFSARRQHFAPGDEVTGAPLADALRHGDKFVVSEREANKSKTTTPKADQADTEGA